MNHRQRLGLLAITAFVLAMSVPAWALPVAVTSQWDSAAFNPGGNGLGSAVYLDGNNVASTANGGLFHFVNQVNNPVSDLTDFVGETVDPTTYLGVCIELVEHLGTSNPLSYTVTSLDLAPIANASYGPMGLTRADSLARLWEGYFDVAVQGDREKRGALQAAVWDIVYDGGAGTDPLSEGTFTMQNVSSNAEYELASAWLGNLDSYRPARLVALTHDGQDFVVEVVPETGSVLLWFTVGGVFGVGCWFRRRRQIPS